ncbi:Translationally-controlled tumor protein-like [Holothuria leucospilota]|uniref:Translationally-controlled tumor protein-like n=1 Tax=Holothuria leucospilota TaxID=206669 RepID=A0A9Q1HBB2_HOLLE|nr:Translationally-controlled tumor protein-like [Holothuria leucospilota]
MVVYQDIISGDEFFYGSHPFTLVDDLYYEVYGRYILIRSGGVKDTELGGNRFAKLVPAEQPAEQPEKLEEVIDLVEECQLQNCPHISQEKYFPEYLKPYTQTLIAYYEKQGKEKADIVKDKLNQFRVILREKFKSDNFQFFEGRSHPSEGMIALVGHKEKDGKEIPYMILFKDGLKEV